MTEECNGCANCKEAAEAARPKRRTLLGWIVGLINLALASAVFGPVLGFIGAPVRDKHGRTWVPVLNEGDLKEGEIQETKYTMTVRDGYMMVDRRYTVFLKRTGDEITCFDPSCTHLGCRVQYRAEKEKFMCPCHGGVFDQEGNVVSGPPPKPLVRHEAKIERGKIWISREV